MNVRLMNPELVRSLYQNHGEFACKCYDTPAEYAERVGKSCVKNGHFSGSRCEYIKFEVTGIDRGTAEQALRHEIGAVVPPEYQDNYSFSDYAEMIVDVSPDQIVKNMASFRYIDKTGFQWETPSAIEAVAEAKAEYDALMEYINEKRTKIKGLVEAAGVDPKASTEAANFVLPRATLSEFVIGFTPEALIRFCHKRMCSRAQEFAHELALAMKRAVAEVSPDFAKELVPHCAHLLWCPEGNMTCGLYPKKAELRKMINRYITLTAKRSE